MHISKREKRDTRKNINKEIFGLSTTETRLTPAFCHLGVDSSEPRVSRGEGGPRRQGLPTRSCVRGGCHGYDSTEAVAGGSNVCFGATSRGLHTTRLFR